MFCFVCFEIKYIYKMNFTSARIDSEIAQALDNYDSKREVPIDPNIDQHQHQQQRDHHLQQQHEHQRDHQQQQQHQQHHSQLLHHQHHQQEQQDKEIALASAAVAQNPSVINSNPLTSGTNIATDSTAATASINASNNSGINTEKRVSKPRINKPGQKFGAKKKSWVWAWFIQDMNDNDIATCDVCNKPIKRLPSDKGSPKKLAEHLKTHKVDKESINPKRDSISIDQNNNEFFQPVQQPVQPVPSPLQHEQTQHQHQHQHQHQQHQHQQSQEDLNGSNSFKKHSKFQKNLVSFLIENKLPLDIAKSSSFKTLILSLKPKTLDDLNNIDQLYNMYSTEIINETEREASSSGTNSGNTATNIEAGAISSSNSDAANANDNNNTAAGTPAAAAAETTTENQWNV